MIGFGVVQAVLPKTATLPPRLFKQRSLVAGFWSTFTIMCGNYIVGKTTVSHLGIIIFMTDHVHDHSLLSTSMVSIYQRCNCYRVRHPHSAFDATHGPRVNHRRTGYHKGRILHTICDFWILRHDCRGWTPYHSPGRFWRRKVDRLPSHIRVRVGVLHAGTQSRCAGFSA